jgi:tRNA (guanosine-2'-O-)-methyltransferase
MVESLNISVACAVSLYEAYRQRLTKGYYNAPYRMSSEERDALFLEYERRSEKGVKNKKIREE